MRKKLLLTQAVLASTILMAPLSHAFLSIDITRPGPILTSVNGNIEIETKGSISGKANIDGVVMDLPNSTLKIDADNINGINAIQTTGSTNIVADVLITSPNATVEIGQNSGVNGASTKAGSDAILINNAANAKIINAGTIENSGVGADAGIEFLNTSSNGRIANLKGSVIQTKVGVLGPTIKQSVGSSDLSIINEGTIQQFNKQDTILLRGSFTEVVNKSGGLITQSGGGNVCVIAVEGGGAGNIINHSDAVISAAAGSVGLGIGIEPFNGNIFNGGTISTIDQPAVLISKSMDGKIINFGSIVSTNPEGATIFVTPAVIKGGIINHGTIQNIAQTTPTLKLSFAEVTLTQNDGMIHGEVILGKRGSKNLAGVQPVLIMNGGTVIGNIFSTTSAGDTNLLTLNGGTLEGDLQLGDNGDKVNLSGTLIKGSILGGNGNDTVDVKGGNFNSLEGGNGVNTLNVLASFTPNGVINKMDFISVQNAGTILTLNQPITNMNGLGLVLNVGTQMDLNADISGSGDIVNNGLLRVTHTPTIDLNPGLSFLANNGTTQLGSLAVLTVESNVSDAFFSGGGTLQIDIEGLNNGILSVVSSQIGAVNLKADSFVVPIFAGFIPQGAIFEIVNVKGGGTILANDTLIQPSSAVIAFTQSLNKTNNALFLTTIRKSYESLSSTQVTQGVAGALDALAQQLGPNSVALTNLLAQLDQLPTQGAVEAALESLAPPFNYGLIAGSHVGMDNTFESVQIRLEDLRARRRSSQLGMSYGDPRDSGNMWGKVLGAHLNQRERGGVAGYKAKGAGGAIGADWGFNDCTTLGFAGSYTKVNVDDKNASPKDQAIKSWQGTAYGWFELMNGLYLDAMVGIARNHYKTNHVINVNQIHTATQASFHSRQWGAQTDLGWCLGNCKDYYFAPFTRLKYIQLNLENFTEKGAGDIGLNTQSHHNREFLGGVGFRVGSTCQTGDILIVPELLALIAYDFKNNGEQTFAGFIGGGPTFLTNGIKPGRTIFDLGLGINAHMTNGSIFTAKYNLEKRSKFVGNAFYLQYNYCWS